MDSARPNQSQDERENDVEQVKVQAPGLKPSKPVEPTANGGDRWTKQLIEHGIVHLRRESSWPGEETWDALAVYLGPQRPLKKANEHLRKGR
jgi:hypothetical protein